MLDLHNHGESERRPMKEVRGNVRRDNTAPLDPLSFPRLLFSYLHQVADIPPQHLPHRVSCPPLKGGITEYDRIAMDMGVDYYEARLVRRYHYP